MSFRGLTHLMRSMIPRHTTTRELLREKRLVAALFDPRWTDEGPRPDRRGGGPREDGLAGSLRGRRQIGDFATLFLEQADERMTLECEGRTIRTIRVGRPAERLGSSSFLVEMDGGAFVATGRELGFLFAPQPAEAGAAD